MDTTTIITFVMAFLFTLGPMWLGGVTATAQCIFALVATIGFLALNGEMKRKRGRVRAGLWVKILLAMAVLSLLQVVPFPIGMVEFISPETAKLVLSMGESLGGSPAVAPFSLHPSATLLAGIRVMTLAFLFMIVVERVRKGEREGALLLEGLVAVGALILVITGVQSLFTTGPLLGSYLPSDGWVPRRVVSTFINENHQAAFFNLMGFTALGLSLNEFSFRKRSAYGTLGLLMLMVSVLSGSRAAWGATAIGGILYLVLCQDNTRLLRKSYRMWSFIGGVTVLVLVALLLLTHSPDSLLFSKGAEGLDTKLDGMLVAVEAARSFPVLGVGADAFVDVAAGYNHLNPNLTLTHPENGILQLVVDYGVPLGLLFAFSMIVVGSRVLWMGISQHEMLGAAIGVMTVCIQNLADFSLSVPGVAFSVIAILAIMDGQTFVAGKSPGSRGIPRRVANGLSLIGVVMVGFAGAYTTFADARFVDDVQRNMFRDMVESQGLGEIGEVPSALNQYIKGAASNAQNKNQDAGYEAPAALLTPEVERYMKLRPADGHPLFIQALIHEYGGNLEGAIEWLELAKQRAPYQLSIRLQDARYMERKGEAVESAKKYNAIFADRWGERRKIIKHLSGTIRDMSQRGMGINERVVFLDGALPRNSEHMLNILFLLKQEKIGEESLRALQSRVRKYPDSLELRAGLAAEFIGSKKFRSAAEQEVTQLIARHPTSGQGYYFQGMLYEIEGKNQQAWAMYKEAYERTDTLLRAALGQYRMEVALGRWEQVRESVGRVRGSLGKDQDLLGEMHRLLSLIAEAEGNMDEAILEMELATRFKPVLYPYWRRLATLCEESGQKGRALDAYEAVLAREPWNREALKEVTRLRAIWAPIAK